MRFEEFVDAVVREGELLAGAVDGADLSVEVDHCPGWTVRDLVRHIGMVHRRVTVVVGEGRAAPVIGDELARLVGPVPDGDAGLAGWYREGHAALVAALRGAPQDLRCWTFVPSPDPLGFWARRQAHETAIHRLDAQRPYGVPDEYPAAFAADGVDELLVGILGATRGVRGDRVISADQPRALQVHSTDTGQHWTIRIGPDGINAVRRQEPTDATVSGPAAALYPLLWNRGWTDDVTVDGDPTALQFWRDTVTI